MKTFTKTQIETMLETKEISFTESLVLDFQRKEYESALEKIEAGEMPAKMYGRKLHPIHIEKIVAESLRKGGRLTTAEAGVIADRFGINETSVVHISCVVSKKVFPDKYAGKTFLTEPGRWVIPYIEDYISDFYGKKTVA